MMDWFRGMHRYYGDTAPYTDAKANIAELLVTDLPPATLYQVLRAYYQNNRLYEWLSFLFGQYAEWNMENRPWHNPAYRSVEFFAAHLWPGNIEDAFEIETKNERIIEPIHNLWRWSNMGAKKQIAARRTAMLGDLWIRVATSDDQSQVVQQLIDPAHVTDFDEDSFGRQFLKFIRMDFPKLRDPKKPVGVDGNYEYWITEVWDKDANVFMRWLDNRDGPEKPLDELGPPDEEIAMKLDSQSQAVLILQDGTPVQRRQFGFDFIPIVRAPFIDIGLKRGVGSFTLSIAKIDKLDEIGKNFLETMFPDVVWAFTSESTDKSGRPTPGVTIDGRQVRTSPDAVQIMRWPGGNKMMTIPTNSDLKSLIPDIPIADEQNSLNEYIHELERDMPELAYARLTQMDKELSGKAIRLLLSGAIDKTIEARGNLHPAWVRSHQMALTIGSLPGGPFSGIGTFEAGDFEHSFKEQEVLKRSQEEELEQEVVRVEIANAKKLAGWDQATIFKEYGYTDQEVDRIMGAAEEEKAAAAERFTASLAAGAVETGSESGFGGA